MHQQEEFLAGIFSFCKNEKGTMTKNFRQKAK